MDNGEKLIALENVIYQNVFNQFVLNNVSPLEAIVVMKNVLSTFQETCINTMVMNGMMEDNPQEEQDTEKIKTSDSTAQMENEENDSKDI